jgi:hypothetical protein
MDSRYLAFAGIAAVLTITPGTERTMGARLAFVKR